MNICNKHVYKVFLSTPKYKWVRTKHKQPQACIVSTPKQE